MPLTTTLGLTINATHTKVADQRTLTDPIQMLLNATLADGTGAGKANKVFYDERTLTTGATEDLDLAAALTDGFGATITMTKVRLIAIKAAAANTTALTVGNGTNPFIFLGAAAHTVILDANDAFILYKPGTNGIAVTAGTGDILKVANGSGASATYQVLIVGE